MNQYLTLTEPTMGENTYVIINDQRQAVIVDPGVTLQRLQQAVQSNAATPVAIILTHGHYDHLANVDAIAQHYQIPAYIHAKDANCFVNPRANLGNITLTTIPERFKGSEGILEIADFAVAFWHSPGHSPGSTVFQIDEEPVMVSGDVLFNGSIGRFDFPTSNEEQHRASLQRLFATFADQVKVLPGHGMPTTIAQERQHNPFKDWF
ncbi:MAG: MBL fold metallo-hydrolase [Culicoidibacterales bacterium]